MNTCPCFSSFPSTQLHTSVLVSKCWLVLESRYIRHVSMQQAWSLVWPHFCRTLLYILQDQKLKSTPIKKSSCCVQLSKSCQKLQNSDFKSQLSMTEMVRISFKKNHFENRFFINDSYWQLEFLSTLHSKMMSNFWRLLLY